MADLTAAYARPCKAGPCSPTIYPFLLGAIKVFQGDGLMVIRGTGYAVKMADTALGQYIGVAMETVDNSAGAAGALSVQVRIPGCIEYFLKTTPTIADVGILCGAVDSQTVETTSTEEMFVGRIIDFDTVGVWVNTNDSLPTSHAS